MEVVPAPVPVGKSIGLTVGKKQVRSEGRLRGAFTNGRQAAGHNAPKHRRTYRHESHDLNKFVQLRRGLQSRGGCGHGANVSAPAPHSHKTGQRLTPGAVEGVLGDTVEPLVDGFILVLPEGSAVLFAPAAALPASLLMPVVDEGPGPDPVPAEPVPADPDAPPAPAPAPPPPAPPPPPPAANAGTAVAVTKAMVIAVINVFLMLWSPLMMSWTNPTAMTTFLTPEGGALAC